MVKCGVLFEACEINFIDSKHGVRSDIIFAKDSDTGKDKKKFWE
jgi:hypothetical protein